MPPAGDARTVGAASGGVRPFLMPPFAAAVAARVPVFYGWVIVAVGGLAGAATMGILQVFSIFLPHLQQDLGASRATLSLAFSVSMLVYGVGSMVSCGLVDRHGTRRLAAAGAVIFALGMFVASRAQGVGQLILGLGVIVGFGMGAIQGPMQYLTARWFDRRKGLALGILLAGAALGTMVASPLSQALIRSYGWQATFVVLGLVAAGAIFFTAPLLVESPEACGLRPDGASPTPSQAGAAAPASPWTNRTAFRTGAFWTLAGTWVFCCTSHSGPLVHVAAHAMDVGVGPSWAAGILSGFGAAAFAGRIVLGLVADRIGGRLTLIGALGAQALLVVAFSGLQSPWSFIAVAVAFGVAYGGAFAQYPVLLREYFGATGVGAVYGAAGFVNAIAMAAGPYLTGLMRDVTGDYVVPFWVSGTIGAAGAFLAIGLSRPTPPIQKEQAPQSAAPTPASLELR